MERLQQVLLVNVLEHLPAKEAVCLTRCSRKLRESVQASWISRCRRARYVVDSAQAASSSSSSASSSNSSSRQPAKALQICLLREHMAGVYLRLGIPGARRS